MARLTKKYFVGGVVNALGNLMENSKNPTLQNIGNIASTVSSFTPAGKIAQKGYDIASNFVPGLQNNQAPNTAQQGNGALAGLSNMANNVNNVMGALGPLANLIAKHGMAVPKKNSHRLKYAYNGVNVGYPNGENVDTQAANTYDVPSVSTGDNAGFLFGEKSVIKDDQGKEIGRVNYKSDLAKMLGAPDVKASFNYGGKITYASDGVNVGNPDTDPKKPGVNTVRNPSVTTKTADVSFRNNEGMLEATGEGKIDAYNFTLPDSGRFDDMTDDEKKSLLSTDFGKEYLSGDGSLDDQYNVYATQVSDFMQNNPEQALSVVNDMIESGNENFQVLKGLSDEEKLAKARRYMTDKKVGDFHGAITFGEKVMPTVSFYNPNTTPGSISNIRVGDMPRVLRSVGPMSLNEGDVMRFQNYATARGVDVSQDTPEAREALKDFMSQSGSSDFTVGVGEGKDNYALIKSAESNANKALQDREAQARARRQAAAQRAAALR